LFRHHSGYIVRLDRADAGHAISDAIEGADSNGRDLEVSPVVGITANAREHDLALLVMGTHGYDGLWRRAALVQ
jgi:hypothetical protein